ncbi:MAG: hypothetical protein HOQ05_13290 [Corynebacteriales bacterium]|nr:hypothetical protein [Mycobacteriales bacterium]
MRSNIRKRFGAALVGACMTAGAFALAVAPSTAAQAEPIADITVKTTVTPDKTDPNAFEAKVDITNIGDLAAKDVTLHGELNNATATETPSEGWTCPQVPGANEDCKYDGDFPAGHTSTFTIPVKLVDPSKPGGFTATVNASNDGNASNNEAVAEHSTAKADVSVNLEVTEGENGEFTAVLTVKNEGEAAAKNATLKGTQTNASALADAVDGWNCPTEGQDTEVCTHNGDFAAGAESVFNFTGTVDDPSKPARLEFEVAADNDSDASNNTDAAEYTAPTEPSPSPSPTEEPSASPSAEPTDPAPGNGGEDSGDESDLPVTGTAIGGVLIAGAALLAGGIALAVVARKRRAVNAQS